MLDDTDITSLSLPDPSSEYGEKLYQYKSLILKRQNLEMQLLTLVELPMGAFKLPSDKRERLHNNANAFLATNPPILPTGRVIGIKVLENNMLQRVQNAEKIKKYADSENTCFARSFNALGFA
jgi:hypothetical protein